MDRDRLRKIVLFSLTLSLASSIIALVSAILIQDIDKSDAKALRNELDGMHKEINQLTRSISN